MTGGNYLAFQFLRKLGMSVYIKTRDGKNLLQLLVDSAPCFEKKAEEENWSCFFFFIKMERYRNV